MDEDMTSAAVPVEDRAAGADQLFPPANDFSSLRGKREAREDDRHRQAGNSNTYNRRPAELELRHIGVDQDRPAKQERDQSADAQYSER